MNSTIATTTATSREYSPHPHHSHLIQSSHSPNHHNGDDDVAGVVSAVATPLMQFAYTTWEAVEFIQVAHDTVTSGWWGSAYPDQQPSSNSHQEMEVEGDDDYYTTTDALRGNGGGGEVVTLSAGHGTRLQSSADIAETLPASFIQHRQLITTIGEITVSKLREVAVVVRTDDSASGVVESQNALLSLVESSMDALAHICEIATLPLHESKGSNAVAASVCVEAAKGVLNIVSELSFLSGADFSVSQREAVSSQRNQLLAPHVVTLSTLMKRLISELSQPREREDDTTTTTPTIAFLSSFVGRFERIITAIREIDNNATSHSLGGGRSVSGGGAPRLGRIIIDVASQVVRLMRALGRSNADLTPTQ